MDDTSIPFEDLVFLKKVGKGSFGSVHAGEWLGTKVAIKQVHEVEDADLQKYFQREVSTLSAARHPNIIQFMGVSKDDSNNLYIVTEFSDGRGDLRQVNETEELPWTKRVEIALGIARGMAFLHARGIIHRDMKSENILIQADYSAKICDFGFARTQEKQSSRNKHMTMCGTDWTMAPEIILAMDYNELVDVFSYGMVLGELFSRIKPSSRHFKRVIPGFGLEETEVRSLIQPGCPESMIELTLRCVDDNPKKRPPFVEIVKSLQAALEALKTNGEPTESSTLTPPPAYAESPLPRSPSFVASPPTPTTPVSLPAVAPKKQDKTQSDALTKTLELLKLAGSDERVEDVDGVLVKRFEVPVSEQVLQEASKSLKPLVRYEYVVENRREYDIRVILSVEGTAVQMVPAGAPAKKYPGSAGPPVAVDCLVGRGKTIHVAHLQQVPSDEPFNFRVSIQCFRAQVDVRQAELNGVVLESRIFAQPDISEVSFYAVSSKTYPVILTVDLKAEGGLEPGNDNPLIVTLPAKSTNAVCIGRIRTAKAVSFSWKWAQVVPNLIEEQVAVMNGIRLTKRIVPGASGGIELRVDNARTTPVEVDIILTGPIQGGPEAGHIKSRVEPAQSKLVGVVMATGDCVMDWKWIEVK